MRCVGTVIDMVEHVRREGWAVTGRVRDEAVLDQIAREVPVIRAAGVRNLLERSAAARRLAASEDVAGLARAVLGDGAFVVRAILFDKTPDANWKVPWHQDVTIAVAERIETEGYGPWSVKDGVMHVRPPADVLERMLVIRVHLDDCFTDNGPVRVLPGTHQRGFLSDDGVEECKRGVQPVECITAAGGVLAFFPLLLHASSAADRPHHRRVAHFEFANVELPNGLRWAAGGGG